MKREKEDKEEQNTESLFQKCFLVLSLIDHMPFNVWGTQMVDAFAMLVLLGVGTANSNGALCCTNTEKGPNS